MDSNSSTGNSVEVSNAENVRLALQLKAEMRRKGIMPSQVIRELEINRSTFYGWLAGSVPKSVVTLLKLANYFGTDLDTLVSGIKPQHSADNRELENPVFVLEVEPYEIHIDFKKVRIGMSKE